MPLLSPSVLGATDGRQKGARISYQTINTAITISQGSEKNIPAPHQGDFHLKIPIKLNATCLLKPQILESQAPTRPFPESISHVKKPADDYLR